MDRPGQPKDPAATSSQSTFLWNAVKFVVTGPAGLAISSGNTSANSTTPSPSASSQPTTTVKSKSWSLFK